MNKNEINKNIKKIEMALDWLGYRIDLNIRYHVRDNRYSINMKDKHTISRYEIDDVVKAGFRFLHYGKLTDRIYFEKVEKNE